jgi:periplasmic divalent cation tolerance protein
MTDKRIVMTTAGSVDEARRIAETLVDHKLAACVNIVPKIVSIYRWKGKVEEAEEWLLSISIDEGSPAYLKWLEDSSNSG